MPSARRRTPFTILAAAILCVLSVSPAVAQETIPAPGEPVTPNAYQGSDSERINQAVAAAAASGRRVVIPRTNYAPDGPRDLWLLDSAILVQSGTTLELENCRIKLSDRCRDNFIRSANCGLGITDIAPISNVSIRGIGAAVLEGADHPRATGDSAKILGERTYGTDANVADESQSGDWRNIGILLAFVEQFSIENIRLVDSHAWAISLERCAYGIIRDIDFASTGYKTIDGKKETILNQDGLDLRQGCHDILIENLTGYTGDDLLALTNILRADATAGTIESTMVSAAVNRGDGADDIRNITIRNLRGYCAGGHHIVRFLNASGLRIHDVILDGLIDTSGSARPCRAAIKIGDSNPRWGGVTPLGDTYRFFISNIMSRSQHTVLIAGSLSESIVSNVIKYEAEGPPITMESGEDNVRNVIFSNVREMTPPGE
ncbi:MAG TPA: hypothetical protein PKW60_10220 [Candidatus Hydrogenedentes bacterium]|jgi:hypothetical protein|nr:hypothetical protein [Candidatus Hydrogenedentota bacterium]